MLLQRTLLLLLPVVLMFYGGPLSGTLLLPASSAASSAALLAKQQIMFREECSVRKTRSAMAAYSTGHGPTSLHLHLWPRNTVLYELSPNLTVWEKSQVDAAMKEISSKTCVIFRKRWPWERDYTRISVDPGVCGEAHVCRVGGAQETRFGGPCRTSSVMIHELMHTLCFGHEHERKDRDNWVTFHPTCNLSSSSDDDHRFMLYHSYPYDFYSRMHYECDEDGECSTGGKPKVVEVGKCGRSVSPGLGVMDADKINHRYDCRDCFSHRWRPAIGANPHLMVGLSGHPGIGICRAYILGNLGIGTFHVRSASCHLAGGGGRGKEKEKNVIKIINDTQTQVLTMRGQNEFSLYGYISVDDFDMGSHHNPVVGGMRADGALGFVGAAVIIDTDPTTNGTTRVGVFGTVWDWRSKDHKRPTLVYSLAGSEKSSSVFSFLVCVGQKKTHATTTTITTTTPKVPPSVPTWNPLSTPTAPPPKWTPTKPTTTPSAPSSTQVSSTTTNHPWTTPAATITPGRRDRSHSTTQTTTSPPPPSSSESGRSLHVVEVAVAVVLLLVFVVIWVGVAVAFNRDDKINPSSPPPPVQTST